MLDRAALRVMERPLGAIAERLVLAGVRADAITLTAFVVGMGAAAAIALGHPLVGLALGALSRLGDALDGAVARRTGPTDRGAFLDIALDFLFYASIPLAFALHDPAANALPAALLLAAFIGTGSSFLAFAVLAERRGMHNLRYPSKGFYFLGGLTEGTETLLCFALMCLWPAWFGTIACVFAAMCLLTIGTRLVAGWQALRV